MAQHLKVPCRQSSGSGVMGNKRMWIGDVFGNNSYQAGGDVLSARDLGMSGIEFLNIMAGRSNSGTYYAVQNPPSSAANIGEGAAPAYNNCTILWYYAANSVQVANNSNLSLECLRIWAVGV
jgi:hypothetical protein